MAPCYIAQVLLEAVMQYDERMLAIGGAVMHAYAAIMAEASDHAANHKEFIFLVRQAFSVARRMLAHEHLTFADIYVTAEHLREGAWNVRQSFEKRMQDPALDACFNPERFKSPI